ncbi:sulfotransferase family protein [Thiocapsa marina]|uniref:Sulfotransferase n=1 Tax=Thiocapsa marina 5811 TaxID=768671 RepID=F9UII6_9GAMM|nr:sulfotransferase [Thiocapsa marina]EGV15968.1 sulfotransferase [Thiocapsa marina 5811]
MDIESVCAFQLATARACSVSLVVRTDSVSAATQDRFTTVASVYYDWAEHPGINREQSQRRANTKGSSMLPDFIIIGAHKAGTTSLHHYFDQHPDVFMTIVKEPNYFSFDPTNPAHVGAKRSSYRVRSLSDYEALFSTSPPHNRRGEASPSYLHSKSAPFRIKELLPECRIVASLRNPVDRAYSAYLMAFRDGVTTLRVQEIRPGRDTWILQSLYAESLRRYLEVFQDEQLRFVLFDDLNANPSGVMQKLFRFVGVDPEFSVDTTYAFNPGGIPRNPILHRGLNVIKKIPKVQEYVPKSVRRKIANIRDRNLAKAPPLDPEVRSTWLDFFREDILSTQALIRRDLGHWLD